MRRPARLAVLLAACLVPAGAPRAACIVTATALAFGEYRPVAASANETAGSVTLTCTQLLGVGLSFSIALSPGGGGSYANRRLSSGTGALRYQIHRDAARQLVWGNGTGGTTVLSDSVLLNLLALGRSYPVYGQIPARQNVPAGAYADTVLVTVTY